MKETHVSIRKFHGHGKHYHMRLKVIIPQPEEDFDQGCGIDEDHKANTQRAVKRQLHKWKRKYGKLIINDETQWGDPRWFYRQGD